MIIFSIIALGIFVTAPVWQRKFNRLLERK